MPSTEADSERSNAILQKRSVVSSFLFKYSDIHARAAEVALFRRSDKTDRDNHKRHHLAPISGSIEAQVDSTPLDAAWREFREETSLTPSSVKLWRKGRPFTFQDYEVGREWTIYPFAFLLKSYPCSHTKVDEENTSVNKTDGVVLDWEHNFHNWYDPEEVLQRLFEDGAEATVSGQKLVPRIADSLIRVYPEYEFGSTAGKRLRDGLQQLQDDHASGARELATIALGILRDMLVDMRPLEAYEGEANWGEWWRKVRLAAWHIWTNGRESMGAAIASALITALTELEDFQRDGQYHAEYVEQLMNSLVDERKAMMAELSKAFAAYVKHELLTDQRGGDDEEEGATLRILTLSSSSTIRESILHLLSTATGIHTVDLRVLESRPLFEGVTLASSILSPYQNRHDEDGRPKLNVTLYTDASAALASTDIDILLLGADRLAADGAVSNKTGSLPAVLAAKHVSPQAKVVVLSEVDKVANQDDHSEESNQPAEVMRGWREAATGGRLKGLDVVDATAGRGPATVAVEVKNIYFEWVPPGLVDAYITNEGIKGVSDIQRRSQWIGEQIGRFFDDL
ncbi:uncharacterized protein TRUGW13939_01482 [Talaromyces rugulosus]|uniref:Nudix hydrolase domain-containing protein n=1 Tax=Talaromyces rugulosus TaxID=121627 RepID=A0A7H8QKD6_TALRU|nr:uncharacterized protein TRUGW13939_01482 [Talaromyces rugulosus]QKX54396.1 hypothetical protein TRUGW13939_01482 [Talaromyces rugulosus]